jgi:hypothetical protein
MERSVIRGGLSGPKPVGYALRTLQIDALA